MVKIMSDLLTQRLSEPNRKHDDLVDLMVKELKSEKPAIDEKFAIDALSAILFTSFVTLSPNLTLAFKFLSDNPKVLETLKVSSQHYIILLFIVTSLENISSALHLYVLLLSRCTSRCTEIYSKNMDE